VLSGLGKRERRRWVTGFVSVESKDGRHFEPAIVSEGCIIAVKE
jgi:hypothetical protein